MLIIMLIVLAAFVAGSIYGSFFEWTLHRFLMHRPLLGFTYPFRTHAQIHHKEFGSGPDYHVGPEGSTVNVTMAWWNSPVLVAVNAPVGILASWWIGSWWILAGFLASMLAYYAAYEYLHWCMHVPGPRWFQTTRLFKWIDRHHRVHHLMPDRNLNVVLPIADVIFRTRIARAPMSA